MMMVRDVVVVINDCVWDGNNNTISDDFGDEILFFRDGVRFVLALCPPTKKMSTFLRRRGCPILFRFGAFAENSSSAEINDIQQKRESN